jgi:hypothetical protein
LLVNGVTPGFAVDSEALVCLSKRGIPLLEGSVEFIGINTHEDSTDDGFAGRPIDAFHTTTAKAFPGLGTQLPGPASHGLVATPAASYRSCGDAENHGQLMAPTLRTAGIRNSIEKVR